MEFAECAIPGVLRVRLKPLSDARGVFVKTYGRSAYAVAGVPIDCQEEYYSVSHKDVIRGMHFQIPPHEHDKYVYCAMGAVEDVLLDLRNGSGYGRVFSTVLSAEEPAMLVIPKGVAHGFRSLTDGSLMVYKTSSEYSPSHDRGIRWDSFGYDWRCTGSVLSERDLKHPNFSDFETPF